MPRSLLCWSGRGGRSQVTLLVSDHPVCAISERGHFLTGAATPPHEEGNGSPFGCLALSMSNLVHPEFLAVWSSEFLNLFLCFVKRFELFVKSRSHSKAALDNMSSVARQRQLPSARPGTFIRASLPRLSRSCNGAIAIAAADFQANSINSKAELPLWPPDFFR